MKGQNAFEALSVIRHQHNDMQSSIGIVESYVDREYAQPIVQQWLVLDKLLSEYEGFLLQFLTNLNKEVSDEQ